MIRVGAALAKNLKIVMVNNKTRVKRVIYYCKRNYMCYNYDRVIIWV